MKNNACCPHCGAKQNSEAKTCLSCGKDKTAKPKGKNASLLMKNISKVRVITVVITILLGICAYILEQYFSPQNKWIEIITIAGYVLIALFIIFFVILMHLGNKNYEDSSIELSEYKEKHTNTFFK